MKTTALILTVTATAALAGSENFDKAAGPAPTGWTVAKTGGGSPKWTVEKDDTAPSKPNVLKQSGEAAYPLCIKDDTSIKDGFVEVRGKAVPGKEDQAIGVIWRCKDADNYFVACL